LNIKAVRPQATYELGDAGAFAHSQTAKALAVQEAEKTAIGDVSSSISILAETSTFLAAQHLDMAMQCPAKEPDDGEALQGQGLPSGQDSAAQTDRAQVRMLDLACTAAVAAAKRNQFACTQQEEPKQSNREW
jgi:hypothetical protein